MAGRTGYTATPATFDPQVHMDAIYTHFDALIGQTVANAAALPASGNWDGRTIATVDTKATYLWFTGAGWVLRALPWTSYTPTLTNISPAPTLVARYCVSVGVCHVEVSITLAGAMTSQPTFTLPLTATDATTEILAGTSSLVDTSASTSYLASVEKISTTAAQPRSVFTPGGGAASYANVGVASFPFVFASSDVLLMKFSYRVA